MTSTSFNIGMSLDRASSKQAADKNLNSDSDSDDEDYVPQRKELKELSEEDTSDNEADEDTSDQASCKKRSKNHIRSQKRLKTVTGLLEEEVKQSENIDDLWAEFQKDVGQSSSSSSSVNGSATFSEKRIENSSQREKFDRQQPKTEIVSELFEFAGETIQVVKNVSGAGSCTSDVSTSSTSDSCKGKPLSSILGRLDKKKKLSILEKTKLDWDAFKNAEGISEELQSRNKGKDGYLEKQDFLQRTDLRQFENEKALRNSRRLK